MTKRLFWIILALACAASVVHASPRTGRKLIVVVANRIVLADLRSPNLPNIDKMMRWGSIGLVSANCAGTKSEPSILLTAGAGTSCRGGASVENCFDADEITPDLIKAGEAYEFRTGYKANEGSAVFLGLGPTLRTNAELANRPVEIGSLGSALRKAGIRTCAIGNADTPPDKIDRSAAVLAMDMHGRIDVGMLHGNRTLPGVGGACGIVTDPKKLASDVLRAMRLADFIVVDFGDFRRLENEKAALADDVYALRRTEILRNLDALLGELTQTTEPRVMLISFSPTDIEYWNKLTPVVMYPSTYDKPMLFTSPTTRTPGVIAASDFAPTVLSLFSVPIPPKMIGRAAYGTTYGANGRAMLDSLDEKVTGRLDLELALLWIIAGVGALALTAAAIIVGFSLRAPQFVRRIVRGGMIIVLSALGATLLAAPAQTASGYVVAVVVLIAVFAAIAFAVGAMAKSNAAMPVAIVFALTAMAVIIDGFHDGALWKFAIPSTYQISGFRYYGIGNEFASALISMAVLACLFLTHQASKRKALAIGFGVLTVVSLGVGAFGSNYGGTLAAVVTFGLLIMALYRGSFGARHVIGLTILGAALVVGMGIAEAKVAGISGSHAGRVAVLAERLGADYLNSIIFRKVILNLQTAASHTAQRAYVVFLPLIVLWFYGVQGKVRKMIGEDRQMLAGIKAILVGAVVAFVFNDSGIVMAAIMISMVIAILLFALVSKKPEPPKEEPSCQG